MKLLLSAITMLLISMNSSAQTARIAHRSHGGKNSTFKVAGKDNWGLPSNYMEKRTKEEAARKAKEDSIALKLKADSMAIKPQSSGNKKKTISCKKKRVKKYKKVA